MVSDVQIISVLGGPGSGKGTQCNLLSNGFMCAHFSVGDILRAEAAKPQSPYASLIEENVRLGRVGPKEITVGVLQRHIESAAQRGIRTFFLDGAHESESNPNKATSVDNPTRLISDLGFPRKVDQAEYFEHLVAPISLVVVFECPEETLVQRLSNRSRADDNLENIRRRIETFSSTTSKVLDKYNAQAKVVTINSDRAEHVVFERLKEVFKERGMKVEAREKDI